MLPLPTARMLGLALLGCLFVAFATVEPAMLYVALVYLAGLAGVAVVDMRSSPPSTAFDVVRRCEERFSLGEPNPVDVHVTWRRARHGGNRVLRLWARDERPVEISSDVTVMEGAIAPGGGWIGRYHLHPTRRGAYRFGAVHLRVRTPLGLLVRQHSYRLAAPVQVYPNMRVVNRFELLARRGRPQETGLRHARLFGAGTEFERLRDYQPDDDYRRIAWKATARRQQPVTVQYEAERSQNVILLLDTGRLMAAPVGKMQKLDYAVNAALMLAYMAGKLEDQVGLLSFSDRVELYIPPRRGRRQFHLLLESLYEVATQPVESDPKRALSFLASRHPRRSLMVLFTDLEEAAGNEFLSASLAVLARHHLPLCVTISDPELSSLAEVVPESSVESYEKVVAQRLLDERRVVLDGLERRGILALDVPANQLGVSVVNRYLEIKARTRL